MGALQFKFKSHIRQDATVRKMLNEEPLLDFTSIQLHKVYTVLIDRLYYIYRSAIRIGGTNCSAAIQTSVLCRILVSDEMTSENLYFEMAIKHSLFCSTF